MTSTSTGRCRQGMCYLNVVLWMACLLILPLPVCGQECSQPENFSTFILNLENDTFAGTDRHYTNAIKFSWISKDLKKNGGDGSLPDWSRWLAERSQTTDRDDFLHNLALSLGQNMYTPRDTSIQALIADDRPYAGWTYLSAALHSKKTCQLTWAAALRSKVLPVEAAVLS